MTQIIERPPMHGEDAPEPRRPATDSGAARADADDGAGDQPGAA